MPSTVESWINPQHLDEKAIENYREAFTAHPVRMLVIKDFLREEAAEKLHRFLADNAEYEMKYGLYSVEGEGVKLEEWEAAEDEDRFFRFSQLTGIQPEAYFSPDTLAYMQFRGAFAEPDMLGFFESVTGLGLRHAREDIGVHAMHEGDFMSSHDDDSRDRRLAMITYLTPDWQPEFGGKLNVVHPDGTVTKLVPEYNSIVMFDVLSGATHHVEPVSAAATDAGAARRTIGGWYHRAE